MDKTKKLCLMAILSAAALTIFVIEAQLPAPVPIPGVKLGLANVITLVSMLLLGRKEAGAVLSVRLILGAVFTGSPSSLLYSAAWGLSAYLLMCMLVDIISENRLWALSAISAVAHNMGQLLVCALLVKTPGIAVYAPVLVLSGVITGVFTGLAAMYLLKALRKMRL